MRSTPWLIADFVIVFVAIALLIVRARLNPALALVLGTIALGAMTGVSLDDITAGLNEGFGGLMAEVGLLISLGVIMGFLMSSYGAVQRIVEGILKIFGRRGSPYAFGLALSSVTPAIYFDVLLVVVAPIARRVAARSGRPVASLAGPVALGLAAGNALVVPGAAMLAYLGAMSLSSSDILIQGFAVAIPAAAITTFLYLLVIERLRFWDPARDEDEAALAVDPADARAQDDRDAAMPGIFTALAPVATVLLLILVGILAPKAGIEVSVLDFLGSPVIALLAGVLVALGIVVTRQGLAGQEEIVDRALATAGPILVVTAVAGSLGVIITETGMQGVLKNLFEANATLPLLLVWSVAAVLRMAIGGQTVSGLTAIGIIAPLVGDLGLSPVLVVLAAGAGGCFGGQFSDNAFWMLRSLFGLSTRGTLKTYTLAQSMLSVVTLVIVLVADVFV
ncbi:GntP family permease [Streptomyces tendae]|uniref:GntP family permease n=1 Tax=Streptomyces tendae TaxID=1932 RepID=UPI003D703E8D